MDTMRESKCPSPLDDRSNFSTPETTCPFHAAPSGAALCVCFGVWIAHVFFEIFLRDSAECERRDRAFKKKLFHSPGTARAAPAAEIILASMQMRRACPTES